jgi:hypothetical protein
MVSILEIGHSGEERLIENEEISGIFLDPSIDSDAPGRASGGL